MTKTCSGCNEEKEYSEYAKDKHAKDGITHLCKACRNLKANVWHRKNYTENKENVLLAHSNWRKNNWSKVYKQRKESGGCKKSRHQWYHNKGKFNISYILSERIRQRIRNTITKGYKSDDTLGLLGCNIQTFKLHLESQFTTDMSWDNYGEWHIDHIIPCCSFDLTDENEQHKCFHYTNQRPLWGRDNSLKSKADKLQSLNNKQNLI